MKSLTILLLFISFCVHAQEDFKIEEVQEDLSYEEVANYPEPAAQEQEDMQFQEGEERDWGLASEDMNDEDYQE